jgi:AmiR/NasT family two-component response regulator
MAKITSGVNAMRPNVRRLGGVSSARMLEEKVHDRRLINHAKARLQEVAMLTEDQGYLHMRNASRKTRKPLVVVAQEVLARTAARAERKSA